MTSTQFSTADTFLDWSETVPYGPRFRGCADAIAIASRTNSRSDIESAMRSARFLYDEIEDAGADFFAVYEKLGLRLERLHGAILGDHLLTYFRDVLQEGANPAPDAPLVTVAPELFIAAESPLTDEQLAAWDAKQATITAYNLACDKDANDRTADDWRAMQEFGATELAKETQPEPVNACRHCGCSLPIEWILCDSCRQIALDRLPTYQNGRLTYRTA